LTFQDARLKLLAYVRNEVRNGELTERGFARLIGISQPHAHNVLNGTRNFSPQVFDLVLKYFHLSLLDLAPIEQIDAQIQHRRPRERMAEVAFLATPIGPGRPWPVSVDPRQTFPLPFPSPALPGELVMTKLLADPAMAPTLGSCDIALLDTSEPHISPRGLYVVERAGEAVLRFIRSGTRCNYLVSNADFDRPSAWEPIMQVGNAVRARVIWLGRERDRDAQPQRGRFWDEPISS